MNKYRLEYYHPVQISGTQWNEKQEVEYLKTDDDLKIFIDLILSDTKIRLAFYENIETKKITHIKPLLKLNNSN